MTTTDETAIHPEHPRPRSAKPRPGPLNPKLRKLFEDRDVPRVDWHQPSGRIIAFCHSLIVPAGKFVSKPLRLRPFQLAFLRDCYNPRGPDGLRLRREAVLSIARRGGKTLLAALIILIHLVGPAKRPMSTLVSAATTRKQASIVYRYTANMVRLNPTLNRLIKIVDSTKTMLHLGDLSTYSAISAEAGGQYGEGLSLAIYDEMAQSKNPELYNALKTSLGSEIEPLMVVISTQAPADDHLLSELIDYGAKVRAGEIDDDSFIAHVYEARHGCALDDEQQWYAANPTLGDYRDLDEFRKTMQRAAKIPSLEARVRNLYLNQRVQAKAPFLTANVWAAGNRPPDERLLYDGRQVFGGLDLSARTDLSALVMAVEDDAVPSNIHLFNRIWTPGDTLAERAISDRAPYQVWADQEHLIPVPGRVLDYDFLAADIGDLSGKITFGRIAYDMWRIEVMRQALARMGVLVPLMPFGQGFKSMSPAIEIFEELAIAGRIIHGGQPVLRWCISNAIIERDAANNRKLTKSKSFGRIDAAVAAVMAVAAAKLQTDPPVDIGGLVG